MFVANPASQLVYSIRDLRYDSSPVARDKKATGKIPKLLDEGLGRFARAFESEADLWDKLAELFRKMGRERVRVTHGVQEHGRDIVFYGPGGLGTALYACVVKNDRITGEAGSTRSVRTIVDQAKEAFQYPYLNPDSGQEEQVRQVFILSPYDCSPTAQESISAQVRGFGAVEFCCGAALLDLFSKHWQSFFLESNVLASYLTALRAGLQNDAALIRIILQKPGVLANVPADFERMYVQQEFGQTIHEVSVGWIIDEPLQLPGKGSSLPISTSFPSVSHGFADSWSTHGTLRMQLFPLWRRSNGPLQSSRWKLLFEPSGVEGFRNTRRERSQNSTKRSERRRSPGRVRLRRSAKRMSSFCSNAKRQALPSILKLLTSFGGLSVRCSRPHAPRQMS